MVYYLEQGGFGAPALRRPARFRVRMKHAEILRKIVNVAQQSCARCVFFKHIAQRKTGCYKLTGLRVVGTGVCADDPQFRVSGGMLSFAIVFVIANFGRFIQTSGRRGLCWGMMRSLSFGGQARPCLFPHEEIIGSRMNRPTI